LISWRKRAEKCQAFSGRLKIPEACQRSFQKEVPVRGDPQEQEGEEDPVYRCLDLLASKFKVIPGNAACQHLTPADKVMKEGNFHAGLWGKSSLRGDGIRLLHCCSTVQRGK